MKYQFNPPYKMFQNIKCKRTLSSLIFWWILLVLLSASSISSVLTIEPTSSPPPRQYTKCLVDKPEVIPKKYPFYIGQQAEIVVESSNRPLHMLTTHVFMIFLEEILGFARLRMTINDDDFNVDTTIERLSSPLNDNDTFPRAMVNLGVWVPAFEDTMKIEDHHLVKDCGNIFPTGRFGWFVPKIMDSPIKRYYNKRTDDIQQFHFTLLKDRKFVGNFDMTADVLNQLKLLARLNYETKEYACMENFCENGMFIPPQCRDSNPCALLLTEHTNRTRFVVDHIRELKLHVKVLWLGNNLKKAIDTLIKTYKGTDKSIIILHWTPSEIILRENRYLSVDWPMCQLSTNTDYNKSLVGCKYELHRLVKFIWHKIETVDRILYQAVRSFKFEDEDYDFLLDLFEKRKNDNYRHLACEWMKERQLTWSLWQTDSDTNKIYIGGIFPITGSSYNGAGIVRGALFAKDAINKNHSILPNHNLNLLVSNGRCRADSVMKSFIDYIVDGYYNNLIGVLGPACSDTVEPLAGVSKHYRIMVVSYSAEGASFSDRHKYPYFFRTIGENKHYKHVYLQLFKRLGWKRVASLTEDGQKYTEYISLMQELLEENGISFIANTKFPREKNTYQMTRYLEDLNRKRARIIILDVYDEIARTVLCEASKLKMTAYDGYVWFLPSWLNDTWYDTDYFNEFRGEAVNCSTAEMIRAATGYFSMAHAYFAPDDTIIPENITVAEWKAKYNNVTSKYLPRGTSPYAGYAYDAVWTYALALDKLIKTDPEAVSDIHSENTTNKLVKLIMDTDFMGVSGRIKFRGGPSRFSVINLMEWYDNKSHIVGHFTPNLTEDRPEILGGHLSLNVSALRWFTIDRTIPEDGELPPPQCALQGFADLFNIDCTASIILVNVIIIVVLLACCSGIIYWLKKRYDKQVRFTQKYMRHLGIDLLSTNVEDLDKWEVPRSAVVINRKLGEGAFGMVYAGDANIPRKGWMAVAVKTLKVGSTTEEKLDFLSEAEVMKRFDHKNIIQLLGVVTVDEPIFTVMEFMLYGDLKTYLLARRHLVNESIEESEEISSKRLTQMALDVARALSYLAELKYVHRDVASRNCLVNAQRIVKLGDFGMTRPMFENDYYRFTRKGMLPVRWMAPESLALGVFTPASDVWSYGVLLYEIVTFGSFPYQAMSNAEVLDHVKAGNTITLPQGIKPQLKALMKSCWHQDPKERTRASEIVEYLANNPRILAPCLDIRLASIQFQENQFEINLPDQFRKCSASDIKSSPTIDLAGIGTTTTPLTTSVMVNGASPSCIQQDNSTIKRKKTLRPLSNADSGVVMSMEQYCPKEPLLGLARSSSNLLGLGKYVSSGSSSKMHTIDNNQDEEDDYYLEHDPKTNTFAVSKV